jgi:hypothetical protein
VLHDARLRWDHVDQRANIRAVSKRWQALNELAYACTRIISQAHTAQCTAPYTLVVPLQTGACQVSPPVSLISSHCSIPCTVAMLADLTAPLLPEVEDILVILDSIYGSCNAMRSWMSAWLNVAGFARVRVASRRLI